MKNAKSHIRSNQGQCQTNTWLGEVQHMMNKTRLGWEILLPRTMRLEGRNLNRYAERHQYKFCYLEKIRRFPASFKHLRMNRVFCTQMIGLSASYRLSKLIRKGISCKHVFLTVNGVNAILWGNLLRC